MLALVSTSVTGGHNLAFLMGCLLDSLRDEVESLPGAYKT